MRRQLAQRQRRSRELKQKLESQKSQKGPINGNMFGTPSTQKKRETTKNMSSRRHNELRCANRY
ncbi:hypothetical protein C5167_039779 [Papaver somniferum]|uniref:Uncharacterized protein n=1 Tax=Papaver somniferum TaxID=3469 RepID=A0A4Y7IGJ4_PAPSO|nr:hypothetical protein C5167_039779 [Papaver somniferum]